MSKLDILVTRRLTLRPPLEVDAEPMAKALADPRTSRMLTGVPNPYGVEDALAFINGPAKQGAHFSIYRQRFLGIVSIRHAHGSDADLGYWLDHSAWGNGYMSEATRALVSWYFGKTGAEVITSGYYEDNAASAAVLDKLGFEPTENATFKNPTRRQQVDVVRMALTKERFRAIYGDAADTIAA